MSAPDFHEFRALLAQFQLAGLRDLWVRADDWSIFLATASGSANPLTQTSALEPGPMIAPEEVVTAPYLGILSTIVQTAGTVGQGDRVADVLVLDDRRPVFAGRAGTVGRLLARDGDLVEYGQALLTIA